MEAPNLYAIDIVSKVFACLCMVETAAGVILNPLVLIIILKSKRLRSTSTFKILAVSAINDIFVCLPWNLEVFLYNMFGFAPSYQSPFYCQWLSFFLQYTTLSNESWILLAISVDRLLSMVVKKWSKFYFSNYRPYIFTVLLCLFMAGTNLFEAFKAGSIVFYYDVEVFICYDTRLDWYNIATKLALYFGYLIPVVFLIIVNLLIIYKATQYSRAQKAIGNTNTTNMHSERRKTQMTKMILIITFFYIGVTLPQEIFVAYIANYIDLSFYGNMLFNITNFIQFLYPSFQFLVLLWSNKQFAIEVKEIVLRFKTSRVATMFHLSNQSNTPNNELPPTQTKNNINY